MGIRPSSVRRHEEIAGYLFAAPWLMGFLVFSLGPLLATVYLSFQEYSIVQPPRPVGLNNYFELLTGDPLFWKSLGNTGYYVMLAVPLSISVALGLALLVNQPVRGRALFRTALYIPSVVSGVAVALLWAWLLNPEFGLVNTLLGYLGIKGPLWLVDERWAKPSLVLMSLWGVGGTMVIFLAGLQGVPPHLYEAASLDGAGALRRFWHITLPMLSPTIFFTMVIGIIGSFQVFTQAYVMTQGGPLNATLFYVYYLYRNAFEYFKMGYASAMAVLLFVVIFALTVLQLWLSRRWVYYAGE